MPSRARSEGLIDTQTFNWGATTDPKLSSMASAIIADKSNEVFISAVVRWEIAMKWQLGKPPIPMTPSQYVTSRISRYGFFTLDITLEHTLGVESLPLLHRDPFDRLLVAQRQIESLPIVTADPLLSQYGVPVLW